MSRLRPRMLNVPDTDAMRGSFVSLYVISSGGLAPLLRIT
jgi:hypothetical protein